MFGMTEIMNHVNKRNAHSHKHAHMHAQKQTSKKV